MRYINRTQQYDMIQRNALIQWQPSADLANVAGEVRNKDQRGKILQKFETFETRRKLRHHSPLSPGKHTHTHNSW